MMVWIELNWKFEILVSWNKFVKCKELKDWFQMNDFGMLWFSKCNDFKYFGFGKVILWKYYEFFKGEYMFEMEMINYLIWIYFWNKNGFGFEV